MVCIGVVWGKTGDVVGSALVVLCCGADTLLFGVCFVVV